MYVVIDTNVLIAANRDDCPQANLACVSACEQFLLKVQKSGIVVVDLTRLILSEYGRKVYPNRSRTGDKFLKWLLSNQGNPKHCRFVAITPTGEYQFAEFPAAPDLQDFDPSDRKFVAVALTHPDHPPIYNAVDSDWKIHQIALEKHGIQIEFLCPDCLKAP
jgi:hypothetical protein